MRVESVLCVLMVFVGGWYSLTRATPDCGPSSHTHSRTKRISGGQDAALGEWPWLALIKITSANNFVWTKCSGSLIGRRWILTAAHCLDTYSGALSRGRLWRIRVGQVIRHLHPAIVNESAFLYGIEEVYIHPNYTYNGTGLPLNDIGLIKLHEAVRYSYTVQPVQLPPAYRDLPGFASVGQTCAIHGWGKNGSGGYPELAQQVHLPIIPCPDHSQDLGPIICAGYWNQGIGSGVGDSGAPFVCMLKGNYTQAAVHFGTLDACHPENAPFVLNKIQSYVPWILHVTGFLSY